MTSDRSFGVYGVVNLLTSAIYIGSTCRSFAARKRDHWAKLRLGVHKNSRLQRAWNKHGEGAFDFRIIEVVADADDVLKIEQKHLDANFGRNCYNARPTAESNRGWVVSDETRAAMSRASAGRHPLSDAARRAISEKTKGLVRNPWTKESREKLAAAKRGKPRPKEVSEALSRASRQRLTDPAYRARIAAFVNTPEARRKSLESRQKSFSGIFVAPDGRKFPGVVNLSSFCREHGLGIPSMSQLASGKLKRHKGWTYMNAGSVRD